MSRPHVQSFTKSRPPRRRPPIGAIGKSVVTRVQHGTTVSGKLEITDSLTTLNNFDTIAGAPTLDAGRFTATQFTVIRHKAALLSDYCEVEAVITGLPSGKSRIMFCGDDNFSSWYGLEVETGFFNNNWTICQGKGINTVLKVPTARTTAVNDVAKIRYDKPAGQLRMYRNGTLLNSVPVPPKGLRRWGLATGIDGFLNVGVLFTSVTARDL